MQQVANTQTMTDIFNDLRRIFQALNEQSKQAEKMTGLTGPQLWAIQTIARETSIQVSALAGKMFLHPATVVGILNRLEGRGLIVRNRTKRDRRVVEIELTEAGKAFVVSSPEVPQGKLASGLLSLSATEMDEVHRSLQCLVSILDAQDIKPAPIKAVLPKNNQRS
ncbi:MAG: MarR family transcriptional regulator [Geobacteraceae bacterium]|nr:MarR family transcriptional regulator [Geobacteraceae bacterium]